MNRRMNEPRPPFLSLYLLRASVPVWKNTWWGSSCSGFQGPLGAGLGAGLDPTGQSWDCEAKDGELSLAP